MSSRTAATTAPAVRNRIPLWVKLAYTGFLCILVPCYWHDYGPTNFLWFCDVSLFMVLVAVWRRHALWASMPAVGTLVLQAVWIVDFLAGLVGLRMTGMPDYMFRPTIPPLTRVLSLYHAWLPLFLLWLVCRRGYDRRGFAAWTPLAWGLILVCYFLLPAPPAPAATPNLPVNINCVYGLSNAGPQDWMHPLTYLALMMVALPIGAFLPTHLLLRGVFRASDYAGGTTRAIAATPGNSGDA